MGPAHIGVVPVTFDHFLHPEQAGRPNAGTAKETAMTYSCDWPYPPSATGATRMFTTELSTRPASAGERLQQLTGAAFHRFVEMWRAARNRRSVAKLLEWDEHMLRDIGLTQSDVRSAMALPAGGDPSDRLVLA